MEFLRKMNSGALAIKPLGFFRVILFLVVLMLFESILYIPVSLIYQGLESMGSDYHYYFSLVAEIAVKIILFYWVVQYFTEDGEVRTRPLTDANGVFWIVVIMIGCRVFYDQSFGPFFESFISYDPYLMEAFDELLFIPWLGMFSILIIAPIYEEIIFRGIVMKGMMRKYPPWVSIFFSALFFGVYHVSALQGINAFYIGLVIGIIYYFTDSIYWAMIAHFLNNAYVMFIGDVSYILGQSLGFWTMIVVAFIGGMLMFGGLYYLYKITGRETEQAFE